MIPAAELLTIVGVVLLGAVSPGPDCAVSAAPARNTQRSAM